MRAFASYTPRRYVESPRRLIAGGIALALGTHLFPAVVHRSTDELSSRTLQPSLELIVPFVKPSQLISEAELIVRGKVLSISSPQFNSAGSLLYRDYTVQINRLLKGGQATEVTVRDPGGYNEQTSSTFESNPVRVNQEYIFLLATEHLPLLDMTNELQYYILYWRLGLYAKDGDDLIHHLHSDFSEPVAHLESRVAASNEGLPDPYPLPGLPVIDSDGP